MIRSNNFRLQKQLKVRVFLGGKGGQSRASFHTALGLIKTLHGENINVEILDTDLMKKEGYRFTPKQFIDWLLEADIHIIVGHLHQGLDHLSWDMEELLEEYKRLRGHIGFTGGALDPVFLQDKFNSLLALDKDDYLPTLRISMPTLSEDGELAINFADLEKIQQ